MFLKLINVRRTFISDSRVLDLSSKFQGGQNLVKIGDSQNPGGANAPPAPLPRRRCFKDVPNPVLRIYCRTGLGTAWLILEISLGSAQSRSWNSFSKLILLVPNLDFIFMTLSQFGTGDLAQPEWFLWKQIHTYLKNLWKLMYELLEMEILKWNLLCKLFLLVPNLNLCLIKSSHYRTILGNFWNPFRICPSKFC